MNSLDFLDLDDLVQECLKYALGAFLGTLAVGLFVWGGMVLFSTPTEAHAIGALVVPFFLAAVYGNLGLYNIRFKHGIRAFRSRWWYRILIFSLVWSIAFVALALAMQYLLIVGGVIAREPPDLLEIIAVLGATAGCAMCMCILPARQHFAT